MTLAVGDIICIVLIIICLLIIAYKIGRIKYYEKKYSVCPKCGGKTSRCTETEHLIGDIETYEKFYCGKLNCDWEEKVNY